MTESPIECLLLCHGAITQCGNKCSSRHLFKSHLVSVRVHGRQEVDASLFDQADDALVPTLVLLAHELHQIEQELSTQHLVPMHPCNVSELWLSCGGRQNADTGRESRALILS